MFYEYSFGCGFWHPKNFDHAVKDIPKNQFILAKSIHNTTSYDTASICFGPLSRGFPNNFLLSFMESKLSLLYASRLILSTETMILSIPDTLHSNASSFSCSLWHAVSNSFSFAQATSMTKPADTVFEGTSDIHCLCAGASIMWYLFCQIKHGTIDYGDLFFLYICIKGLIDFWVFSQYFPSYCARC